MLIIIQRQSEPIPGGLAVSILCERIIAVMAEVPEDDPALDWIDVGWHELDKRALSRKSRRGQAVRIILPHDQRLEHGAVVAREGSLQIVINLLPCPALVIDARSATELAQAAYAIGNLHVPAQIESGQIILPADRATEAALGGLGISYQVQTRRISPIPNVIPKLTVANNLTR
jgi:urease accessory protein